MTEFAVIARNEVSFS